MILHRNFPLTLSAIALWFLSNGPAEASAQAVPADDKPEPTQASERAYAAYVEGRTHLQNGNALKAMEKFRVALREDPRSIDALNGLAVALDRVGRFDLSRPQYETALALDPDSPVTLHNFGLSLTLQGNRERGLAMLQRAASLGDPALRASSLAMMARLGGKPPAAAPEMQAARVPADAARPVMASQQPPPPQPAVAAGPAALPTTAARDEASPLPVQSAMLEVPIPTDLPEADAADPLPEPKMVAVPQFAHDSAPGVALVRIGAGEWRLADPDGHADGHLALAHVPLWTDEDERAADLEELARLAALSTDGAEPATAEANEPDALPATAQPRPDARRTSAFLALLAWRPEQALHDRPVLRPLAHFLVRQPRRRGDMVLARPTDAPSDGDLAQPRFDAPFQSDDQRLNAFAERMQGRGFDAIGRPRSTTSHDLVEVVPGHIALLPLRNRVRMEGPARPALALASQSRHADLPATTS